LSQLLLATNNAGKLYELKQLLAGIPFCLVSPADIGLSLEVTESSRTYAGNARIKAEAFAAASGLLTLADDSGLEVEVLEGAPGVLSSRYAGPNATDAQRVALLLRELKDIPWYRRKACFKCVIAIARPSDQVKFSTGSCSGYIASEPRGENGFGYDPIFYFPKLNKTMAELPADVKNTISHRARAAASGRIILAKMAAST
jgi:XTP/dITP diphosphohydrolase